MEGDLAVVAHVLHRTGGAEPGRLGLCSCQCSFHCSYHIWVIILGCRLPVCGPQCTSGLMEVLQVKPDCSICASRQGRLAVECGTLGLRHTASSMPGIDSPLQV